MELAEEAYRATKKLPREETYGLQAQIRRAAVSVVSNIAEGAARDSAADFSRFLSISLGSLAELQTQILLAERLVLMTPGEDLHQRIRVVRLMISGLRASLR
jgi:four helix bundle protein